MLLSRKRKFMHMGQYFTVTWRYGAEAAQPGPQCEGGNWLYSISPPAFSRPGFTRCNLWSPQPNGREVCCVWIEVQLDKEISGTTPQLEDVNFSPAASDHCSVSCDISIILFLYTCIHYTGLSAGSMIWRTSAASVMTISHFTSSHWNQEQNSFIRSDQVQNCLPAEKK